MLYQDPFQIFSSDIYLPSPSWTTYLPQSVLAHHKPIAINTTMKNKWKIKASDLEKQFSENKQRNKLLVLINPDNPTGTVYTSDENKAIAEVCKKHDAIVLADEIYSLLNYQERHESIYQVSKILAWFRVIGLGLWGFRLSKVRQEQRKTTQTKKT